MSSSSNVKNSQSSRSSSEACVRSESLRARILVTGEVGFESFMAVTLSVVEALVMCPVQISNETKWVCGGERICR